MKLFCIVNCFPYFVFIIYVILHLTSILTKWQRDSPMGVGISRKFMVGFLEMPTPMRESLCHLVRIELSHTSANPVVKIRSEPLIQVTHESFNPWWESHCATHLEALGSKILICLKINIYLQCNISIKFYKFEHFQRKYICKNCFFTRILQRKFVQSKLKFLKINFYIWI